MRPLGGQTRDHTRRRARRDPAPSRLRYRLNRLWLRPWVRFALRRGLPLGVVLGAAALWLGPAEQREKLTGEVRAVWDQIQERPEFTISLMAIDGASPALAAHIRTEVAPDLPASTFDIDLAAMRAEIERLRPVKQVHLRYRSGGILQVDIIERSPVLVWRRRSGLELLDADGASIADLDRRDLAPHLPLVAGEGADAHVAQALRLLAAARPLGDRVRGLVRVGERRWDLVLDRGQRVLLPTDGPLAALDQLVHLHQQEGLLAHDITRIDMRLPERPTLRRAAQVEGAPDVEVSEEG